MEKRIAIISDIHGNLPALTAVLEDIRAFGADETYCLGDLTDAAPWHNEVIDLIRARNIPTIMGNHDERIAFDLPILPLQKHGEEERQARIAAINHTKATIHAAHRSYLSQLPHSMRFSLGGKNFLLVHGSPASNDEYLYENHDASALQAMLQTHHADVMICGHTHHSYIRTLAKGLVINTGSCGRTKEGDGKATYLRITANDEEIHYQLTKVNYDIAATAAGIMASPIPDFYAELLLR
ncbi:metallophosphoesterase family protein [Chitinophaga vietnamensis]|uniref:metallophosphoesterase family protein n=1 Tax=Chitinophaga vietnamensis TaxID=2593957 RepID=UPI001178BA87|nr:metallophosphoesterase family protein [Chitinophaga vietnamensis]